MNNSQDPNFQFFVEKKRILQYHLEPGSSGDRHLLSLWASPEAMAQLTLLLLASMGLKIGTLRPTMVHDLGGEIYT